MGVGFLAGLSRGIGGISTSGRRSLVSSNFLLGSLLPAGFAPRFGDSFGAGLTKKLIFVFLGLFFVRRFRFGPYGYWVLSRFVAWNRRHFDRRQCLKSFLILLGLRRFWEFHQEGVRSNF